MLVEAIIIGGMALWRGAECFSRWKKTAAAVPDYYLAHTAKSDIGQLIVNALQEKDDWYISGNSLNHQDLGIRINYDTTYLSAANKIKVRIKTDGDTVEQVTLPNGDLEIIEAEIKAYRTREHDRKQREIARVLAERVLGSPPTSGSVLGGRGFSSLPSADEDAAVERDAPVSPGMLTYDKNSGKVVQIGDSSAGVVMDDELRERYGLRIHSNMAREMVYDEVAMRYVTQDKFFTRTKHTYRDKPVVYLPPSGDDD